MALSYTERDAALAAASPGLERLARRLVWDDEEARDLVQASLVEALARWHTLGDASAAPGWLRRIVVNRAISHLRRRRLWRTIGALLLVHEEPATEGPDTEAEQRAHLRALSAALPGLPARQVAAFTLRYLEGLSLDEVADALDIDRGTVRVHLQRAVKALREKGVLP
jgi:RNA polymerase sigma-70 factor (ECF subfamily)